MMLLHLFFLYCFLFLVDSLRWPPAPLSSDISSLSSSLYKLFSDENPLLAVIRNESDDYSKWSSDSKLALTCIKWYLRTTSLLSFKVYISLNSRAIDLWCGLGTDYHTEVSKAIWMRLRLTTLFNGHIRFLYMRRLKYIFTAANIRH